MAYLEYKPTSTLFQYCSELAFRSIIKSKSIWLTDLASANDPREISLGQQHFIEALKRARHSEYAGERGFFLSILAAHLARYSGNAQVFCACFSFARDSLPLWGLYGDQYRGLSIGFRPTAFNDVPARIQRVIYLKDDLSAEFDRKVLSIAAEIKGSLPSSDHMNWVAAAVSAFSSMTALKHHSWTHENEVRLIHVQTVSRPKDLPVALNKDGSEVPWTQPLKRQAETGPIEYKSFPFGREEDGLVDARRAIEVVIIGPKSPLSEREVTSELELCGFEGFHVVRSECQIR